MTKTAKRIANKIYRYLALMNVVIPAADKEAIEMIILDELKESAKHDAMNGREEMDE